MRTLTLITAALLANACVVGAEDPFVADAPSEDAADTDIAPTPTAEATPEATPTPDATPTPRDTGALAGTPVATPDGDGPTAPYAHGLIRPDAPILQTDGEISRPLGDHEDWFRFTTMPAAAVSVPTRVALTCDGDGDAVARIWIDGGSAGQAPTNFEIACGEDRTFQLWPSSDYILRVYYPYPESVDRYTEWYATISG